MENLSRITPEWLIDNFKEISEDILNGDYIEDVIIQENENGVNISFKVWWNAWGEWLTDKHRYSVNINKDKISISLPEAIEGSGIESELKDKIIELIK